MIGETGKTALRRLLARRRKGELKVLFALIRAHDDRALFAALAPSRKRPAKRAGDPLAREIALALRPLLAPAREKADLLVEHMAGKHRRALDVAPRGLAEAVRRLRAAKFSDPQIRAGAKSLIASLAEQFDPREPVA